MTDRQAKALYWPAWSRALRGNWVVERGVPSIAASASNPDLAAQVEEIGLGSARREHRALGVDDLRHGVHMLALGRHRSSRDLDNRQLDQVLALMRLLADPIDLQASVDHDHPEIAERRRIAWAIRQYHLAYVLSEARRFGILAKSDSDLDHIPVPQLRALHGFLKTRPNARRYRRPAAAAAPVEADANPF